MEDSIPQGLFFSISELGVVGRARHIPLTSVESEPSLLRHPNSTAQAHVNKQRDLEQQ